MSEKIAFNDIKLNLKDLGLNEQLGSWTEITRRKPVMSSTIPVTKDKLLERRQNLKELEIEILEKFCIAFELIPLPILEQFPKFDRGSFKKLQDLYRHVKAKIRLIQTKLSKLPKENEKEDLFESSETLESATSKSAAGPSISCMSDSRLINDNDYDCDYDYDYDNLDSSIIKATTDFRQDLSNVTESYATNVKKHVNNMEPVSTIKNETTVPNKRSTFQLKRPVKTILDAQVSKTVVEMWEKDQQISKTVNSSVDSDCVPVQDTSNDGIKTPQSNKKDMFSLRRNVILDNPDS
jgi:hypothetical protein